MLGRNLTDYLSAMNYTVVPCSRVDVDLMNYEQVVSYFKESTPDVIIHLAGKVGSVKDVSEKPFEYYHSNMMLGLNVLKAAYELRIKKFINMSSAIIYRSGANTPFGESSLFNGELEKQKIGYSYAKEGITLAVEMLNREHNTAYKNLVASNIFGMFDNFDPVTGHMIPAIIRRIEMAKKTGDLVSIWGDGLANRQYIYAKDLCRIIEQIIVDYDQLNITTLNVGGKEEYSVKHFYEKVGSMLNYEGRFVHDLSKPSGASSLCLNLNEFDTLYSDFQYTNIEEALNQTINYFLNHIKC